MADQPNILYTFSDQHRGDTMGCVGHPAVKTPNLDHLASESVTYTQCYTNFSLCMPSRASMMSGLYPREHGLWANDQDADCEGPSQVRQVRDAGYHTALIGKSHLYLHGGVPASHSRDRVDVLNTWGFDDPHELHGPIASGRHSRLKPVPMQRAQRGKDAVISEVLGHTMVFDGRYKLGVASVSEKGLPFCIFRVVSTCFL